MQGNKENIGYISTVQHLEDVGHFGGKYKEKILGDFGVRKYDYEIGRFK